MCEEKQAVLYCSADDAKLCESCDTEMHSANKVVAIESDRKTFQVCKEKTAFLWISENYTYTKMSFSSNKFAMKLYVIIYLDVIRNNSLIELSFWCFSNPIRAALSSPPKSSEPRSFVLRLVHERS